jgi:hypothetical protein
MAWVSPAVPIPVFRYNFFSIALGFSHGQLKKDFHFTRG